MNAVIEKPKWMRAKKLADYMGVPELTLRNLSRMGQVRCKKLGPKEHSATVYCVTDVEEWIDSLPDYVPAEEEVGHADA